MSAAVYAIGGEVLDGPRQFTYLYRLLDLERSATEQAQRLSMPAASEILAAYESDQWREDKQTEWDAYLDQHKVQPQWSPTSERSFIKWLQDRAARDGHPFRSRGMILNLKNAAECVRIVNSNRVVTRVTTLPDTEGAWRPAAKLLKLGFRKQIGAMVERAAEIAAEEGKPITDGIMLAARTEVWKTDPEIRTWVEQPGQVDARSKHDRAVTAYNNAKTAADELRKLDDGQMWRRFADYIQGIDDA
jgi:hypothetical protein